MAATKSFPIPTVLQCAAFFFTNLDLDCFLKTLVPQLFDYNYYIGNARPVHSDNIQMCCLNYLPECATSWKDKVIFWAVLVDLRSEGFLFKNNHSLFMNTNIAIWHAMLKLYSSKHFQIK